MRHFLSDKINNFRLEGSYDFGLETFHNLLNNLAQLHMAVKNSDKMLDIIGNIVLGIDPLQQTLA